LALKTIILPVVSYECETWSLALREEQRLRLFENRVLRRTYGPKRDEVTGEWRKLHSEGINNLYPSPNIIKQIKSREIRWVGEERKICKVLVESRKEKETTWKIEA
jgi:hypothetical protein